METERPKRRMLTHGSLFAGIGGFDLGLRRVGMEVKWQVEIEPFCQKVLKTRFPAAQKALDIRTCRGLTSSVPASHARIGRSRDREKDCQDNVAHSFTSLRESCTHFDPLGSSSRMFPDFSVVTTDETLRKSSGFSWSSAGMGFNGVCLTANFSESPNDAVVCSLSDVLESHVPPRFYLTPRACRGVIRRAKKRKRTLLPRLHQALAFVGSLREDEWKTITTWLFSSLVQGITATHPTEETVTRLLRQVQVRERARLLPQPTNGTTRTRTHSSHRRSIQEETTEDSERSQESIWLPTRLLKTRGIEAKDQRTISSEASTQQTEDTALPELRLDTICLVRRLTPTECEVLQGFPKGWTLPDTELLETP